MSPQLITSDPVELEREMQVLIDAVLVRPESRPPSAWTTLQRALNFRRRLPCVKQRTWAAERTRRCRWRICVWPHALGV